MIRPCKKCGFEFDERDLQLSHDVPRYMGGFDSDGRHKLCKKCHTDYEIRIAMLIFKEFMPKEKYPLIKKRIKNYAKWYFKKEE